MHLAQLGHYNIIIFITSFLHIWSNFALGLVSPAQCEECLCKHISGCWYWHPHQSPPVLPAVPLTDGNFLANKLEQTILIDSMNEPSLTCSSPPLHNVAQETSWLRTMGRLEGTIRVFCSPQDSWKSIRDTAVSVVPSVCVITITMCFNFL